MRIIKEYITCKKCGHTFTCEYPEKHDKITVKCTSCSAHYTLAKSKGKAGLIVGIVIGVVVIIGLVIMVGMACVGGSTLC